MTTSHVRIISNDDMAKSVEQEREADRVLRMTQRRAGDRAIEKAQAEIDALGFGCATIVFFWAFLWAITQSDPPTTAETIWAVIFAVAGILSMRIWARARRITRR